MTDQSNCENGITFIWDLLNPALAELTKNS